MDPAPAQSNADLVQAIGEGDDLGAVLADLGALSGRILGRLPLRLPLDHTQPAALGYPLCKTGEKLRQGSIFDRSGKIGARLGLAFLRQDRRQKAF